MYEYFLRAQNRCHFTAPKTWVSNSRKPLKRLRRNEHWPLINNGPWVTWGYSVRRHQLLCLCTMYRRGRNFLLDSYKAPMDRFWSKVLIMTSIRKIVKLCTYVPTLKYIGPSMKKKQLYTISTENNIKKFLKKLC